MTPTATSLKTSCYASRSRGRCGRSSALWPGANLRRIQTSRSDKVCSVDPGDPFIAPIVLPGLPELTTKCGADWREMPARSVVRRSFGSRPRNGVAYSGRKCTLPSHSPLWLHSVSSRRSSMARPTAKRGNSEHSRHRLTRSHPRERVTRQRRNVVRDDYAILRGGPFENRRIVGARQANVLNPNDIDQGIAPEQSAYDVAVKVLTTPPTQPPARSW